MAGSNQTTVAYIYEHTYAGDLGDVARRRHTLLAKLTKTGGFVGQDFRYPAKYANPGSISGQFARAQANASSSKGVQFAALRTLKYGDITLNGVALKASESKGAFANLVTLESDSVIIEMQNRLAFDLYGNGTGNRGQVANLTSNTITLTDPTTTRNFEPGMTIVAATSAVGNTGNRAGTAIVDSVILSAGQVILVSAAGITGLAANDFLFADGDAFTSPTGEAGCMEGLELLTPLAAPVRGTDSFRGVDRGVYPERLAGSRISNQNNTIEQNAGQLAVQINLGGGMVDSLVLNPLNFYQVATRLNAKVIYEAAGGDATWGFEVLKIATAAGVLTVYADPDCPMNRGREFMGDSMYIRTLDEFVHVIRDDNNAPAMRVANADDIEIRIRSINNLIQSDTRNQGVYLI